MNPQMISLLLLSVITQPAIAGDMRQEATVFTSDLNQRVYQALPFNEMTDFDLASKNLLSNVDPLNIVDAKGNVVWTLNDFNKFITRQTKAPETVNPSLWRMATLNMNHGVYEVVSQVYQVRGYDLSVMSIIDAGTGYVIVDPLISAETAKAGLAEFLKNHPAKPILAVIYTHSHVDHFGGVRGIVDEKDVTSGKIPIIAPDGFLEHAISENVMAGTAMSRRATYMYGTLLPKDAKGNVDAGLGEGNLCRYSHADRPNKNNFTHGRSGALG